MLSVPEVEGTYSLTFRLSGPTGKFGGRLTTEFEVEADEPKQAGAPTDKEVTLTQPNLAKDVPKVIDLTKEEEEPEVSVPQPSAPAPPKKKFQFEKQKDQLKLMGFDMDDETVESVL